MAKKLRPKGMSLEELGNYILSECIPAPEGCLLWPHLKDKDGYGRIGFKGKMHSCHRLVWQAIHGEILNGLHVLHKCDVPTCNRPEHLFLGTNADNMHDRDEKGRGVSPNLSGETNPNSKLTQDSVDEIKVLYSTGDFLQREIGEMFGIGQSQVSRIANGKFWKASKEVENV